MHARTHYAHTPLSPWHSSDHAVLPNGAVLACACVSDVRVCLMRTRVQMVCREENRRLLFAMLCCTFKQPQSQAQLDATTTNPAAGGAVQQGVGSTARNAAAPMVVLSGLQVLGVEHGRVIEHSTAPPPPLTTTATTAGAAALHGSSVDAAAVTAGAAPDAQDATAAADVGGGSGQCSDDVLVASTTGTGASSATVSIASPLAPPSTAYDGGGLQFEAVEDTV